MKRRFLPILLTFLMIISCFPGEIGKKAGMIGQVQAKTVNDEDTVSIANLHYNLTDRNGRSVSTANTGAKVKILVFGRVGCWNTGHTLKNISNSSWVSDPNIEVMFIEEGNTTDEAFQDFVNANCCDDMIICPTKNDAGSSIMWDYYRAYMGYTESITYPVIFYIDENDNIRNMTTRAQSSSDLVHAWNTFCDLYMDISEEESEYGGSESDGAVYSGDENYEELDSASNIGYQDYSVRATPVYSYMVPLENGSVMCFYGGSSDHYTAQYYDSADKRVKMLQIEKELPLFGAFYSDGSYYYILSGQANYDEKDTVEVFRLTKYSRDWQRLSSTGLKGANTTLPFRAGSARMDHDGKMLFIRTCHQMYTSSDGLNHQANVTIQVNTDSMKVVDSYYTVMNISYGYVSHSFNQFIKLDEGYMVGVDHGDAYPRSVVLAKYTSPYAESGFVKSCDYCHMLPISGNTGDNATGVSVGGFEISRDHYLVAGNTVKMGDSYSANGQRNIFVSSVSRNLNDDPVVNYITNYTSGDNPGTPQLVKISDDRFLLLWMKDDIINYVQIDKNGKQAGTVYKMNGDLSDCQPVLINGKIRWYTLSPGRKVVLYSIDASDVSKTGSVSQYLGGDGKNMKECSITLSEDYYEYDSKAKKPGVTVNYYGQTLKENRDYSLTYKNNINAGTASVIISGMGDYSGTVTKTFTISKAYKWVDISVPRTIEKGSVHKITVNWGGTYSITSGDTRIATVDKDGNLKGISNGTVEITIVLDDTANYYGDTDTYTVEVSSDIHTMETINVIDANGKNNVASRTRKCKVCGKEEIIKFTTPTSFDIYWAIEDEEGWYSSYTSMTRKAGTELPFHMFNCTPSDADDQTVSVKSSNPAVIACSGERLQMKSVGKATITFYAKYNPTVKYSYTFTVKEKLDPEDEDDYWGYENYVSGIKISGISHEIAAGRSIQLKATVTPQYASNKKVKWSSSSSKIATVTRSGKVTIKKGTGGKKVTITAKATDGSGVKKSFTIKVMKGAVKSIKIKGARKTLKVGKQMKLKAVVKAGKGKPVNKKVKWSTNNKKYATVSSKGVVKAQRAGKGRKVKITVQATDGTGKKKTVTIKIK